MLPQFKASMSLERYGHNLTRLAKLGAFAPLTGQEAVINRVFQVLQRKNKNIPLILASDETRRWAIVAEVIRRMTIGDAPKPLPTQQVIGLDYEALFTNLPDDTLMRQERRKQKDTLLGEKLAQAKADSDEEWVLMEELFRWPSLEEWIAPTMVLERLQLMFIAMHQSAGSFILYIDHFHRLVGGEPDHYPIQAATLLKPALNRDQIQLIGACTIEQYRQHIERDAAIQRRCQEICLPEVEGKP
jgi:ATP-dependent Clp protease ATP-binding subunit ClpA